jgi:formiminotetrahydrofolate cyclodeaminase
VEELAEKAIEAHGGGGIALIAAILALHLIWKIFELVFDWGKGKAKQSDQSRIDIIRLEFELKGIKEEVHKLVNMGEDTLAAVRIIAGENWHEVARKVKDAELKHR